MAVPLNLQNTKSTIRVFVVVAIDSGNIAITHKQIKMKKVMSLIMALVMVAIMPFQLFSQTESKKYRLKNGTPIEIVTTIDVRSDQTGTIPGEVAADVYAEDGTTILIQKGAKVDITASFQKNGATGKAGKIIVKGASVVAVDGKSISLSTDQYSAKGGSKGGLAWCLAIGTGIFTLVGFLFLLIKGENAEIPAGTCIPGAYVNGNYMIMVEE